MRRALQTILQAIRSQTDIAEVAKRRILAHAGRSRKQPCALGKPTIRAKTTFAVKHLHHKPWCGGRVDGRPSAVDNCG